MQRLDRSTAEYAYSPDAPPRLEIEPGTDVLVETRDPRSGAILVGEPDTLQPYPRPPGGKSNALTGPIRVSGAEPGDVLAIRITQVEPVDVGYMAAKDLGYVVPEGSIESANIGIVAVRDGEATWRGHRIPYRPMVGCLGVGHPDAPPSGAIGAFGGNFDHVVLTQGATVYLPVFVPGANVYVGDVHAAQGDGELSCGGVEIAAEVGLQPSLVKNTPLAQPRIDTGDKIVTTGWSRDFAEAREMAVADMLGLMGECLGMSSTEAFMLISVCGDLRIGQACGNMEMTLRLEMPKLEGMRALAPHG